MRYLLVRTHYAVLAKTISDDGHANKSKNIHVETQTDLQSSKRRDFFVKKKVFGLDS